MFYSSKVITTASLQSAHCKPWLLLCGDQAVLLRLQTSVLCSAHSRAVGSGPRYQILSHYACNSRMSVCFLTLSTCKNVWNESYTLGHCLQSRVDVEGLASTGWTSLTLRSAGPACQQETFKLTDYQRAQPQGHIPKEQLGLRKAFKQEKADDSNTNHNS